MTRSRNPLLVAVTLLAMLLASVAVAQSQPVSTATGEAVVVSGHRLATTAGLEVMGRGGNAVDAAVAVSLALGVAEPYGSGLGGGLVLLYHEATSGRTYCIDALTAAPHSLDATSFRALTKKDRDVGIRSVGVPGQLAGLQLAHERWGSKRLQWSELVEPAITIAERGFEVEPQALGIWKLGESRIRSNAEATRLYLPDGRMPVEGQRLTNPDLARSLKLVARHGAATLYGGELGRTLALASQGAFTVDDLRRYEPRLVEPLAAEYRGRKVLSSPPPLVGGAMVLAALRCLDQEPIAAAGPFDVEHLDAVGRTLRAVYPAVAATIGDVPQARAAAAELLSDARITRLVDAARSLQQDPLVPVGADSDEDRAGGETTHFVVIDRMGNVVSATQSLSARFGSGVVIPGAGFLLNNTLNNFAVNSNSSPNLAAPGKRPRSTMSPTIVLHHGKPVMALGVPAGQRIPTSVLQTLVRTIDLNVPLDEAVAMPRWHVLRATVQGEPTNLFELESDAPTHLDAALERLGWQTKRWERDKFHFGALSAAVRLDDRRWLAVGDQRRTNIAGAN